MPAMGQQLGSVFGWASKKSAGVSTVAGKSVCVMDNVRNPLAAMAVVVSSSSARKLGLRGMLLPSLLNALVHVLSTSSAAPFIAASRIMLEIVVQLCRCQAGHKHSLEDGWTGVMSHSDAKAAWLHAEQAMYA